MTGKLKVGSHLECNDFGSLNREVLSPRQNILFNAERFVPKVHNITTHLKTLNDDLDKKGKKAFECALKIVMIFYA